MQAQPSPTSHDLRGDLIEQASGWPDLLEQLKSIQATSSEVELAFMLFQNRAISLPE